MVLQLLLNTHVSFTHQCYRANTKIGDDRKIVDVKMAHRFVQRLKGPHITYQLSFDSKMSRALG